jgi:hypothetical protein
MVATINQTLMLVYLICSAIGLGFVAIIWSKSDLLNILIKGFFSAAAIVGCFITLKFAGLI